MVQNMKKILLIIAAYSSLIFSQSFSSAIINPFNLVSAGANNTPAFVDINSDGDYDCFAGLGNGFTAFYQNNGSSTFPSFASWYWNAFGIYDVGNNARPAFADMDFDGMRADSKIIRNSLISVS